MKTGLTKKQKVTEVYRQLKKQKISRDLLLFVSLLNLQFHPNREAKS